MAKVDEAALLTALEQQAAVRLQKFQQGLLAYQNHPARRDVVEAKVIWQAGSTKLRDYNPANPNAPIILIIPSLINRMSILDFSEDQSFVRSLARGGLRPLVVDWGEPGEDEIGFGLDAYLLQRLIPIADWISARAAFGQFHLMGYCMGGLLAMMLAAHRQVSCATLTLLATPWDFHQGTTLLVASNSDYCNQYFSALSPNSVMSVEAIQTVFFMMQPLRSLDKFTAFFKLDSASEEAKRFVLLEDWLNNGVALSGAVARDCWRDWYRDNATASGTWSVAGKTIDPTKLAIPSLVVVPGHDVLVPPEQALPLARLLPRATLQRPMIGHIGLMSSRRAPQAVWGKIITWLQENI